MAGAPDLFVVCKNCQSEVSPYITECPYCGQRLRKRAPKLDREGRPSEPVAPPREPPPPPPKPRRAPKRPAPVQRPQARTGPRRPLATLSLVIAAVVATLGYQAGVWPVDALIVDGSVEGEWWRLLTTSFVYSTVGYELIGLTTILVFGWLLERRHGAWATLSVYILGALVGFAVAGLTGLGGLLAVGGNAPALALLCAWAMRDALGRRRGVEDDSDMLGVVVWLAALLLLPLATSEAHVLAGFAGAMTGALLGVPLARMSDR
jgi:membrane associated rhomboid family serine protease